MSIKCFFGFHDYKISYFTFINPTGRLAEIQGVTSDALLKLVYGFTIREYKCKCGKTYTEELIGDRTYGLL